MVNPNSHAAPTNLPVCPPYAENEWVVLSLDEKIIIWREFFHNTTSENKKDVDTKAPGKP